ncbi:MAG TPA: tetraacyldisaccharide 4'-kinase [Burkholderiales bacterium]|nr:tetraacyldisaccharide 4'-kinase [Burkholderiales bacterium]
MHVLEYFWYRIRPAHLLLIPLSLLFAAAAAVRRWLYRVGALRRDRMPVPVIVVGNITVGGTGKTPSVLWLVDYLQERGYRPGVVTRGYGGWEKRQEVRPDSIPARAGDEAVLLARRGGVPVFADRDRAQAARALLIAYPGCDVIVSDDGLQHYALAREIEIAVVDAERRFGNGWLLPAGPLREPVGRLASVDAVLVNGDSMLPPGPAPQFLVKLAGESFRNLLNPEVLASAADLRERTAHAVAGIGNPQRFFAQLQQMGLTFRAHPFPDHFAFGADDLAFARDEVVLMTEKDAVKCSAFARENWWYLPVEAEIDPAFGNLIVAKLRSLNGRQAA